ncbi:hypothetical protein ACFRMQ_21225 [Kitasatospora sp. NPDC056783]|uniref:hypothetical protein n=1 Tax=Kitasatospora sp. NPDC056783 TaxID=3345943 RepID=UPI003689065D
MATTHSQVRLHAEGRRTPNAGRPLRAPDSPSDAVAEKALEPRRPECGTAGRHHRASTTAPPGEPSNSHGPFGRVVTIELDALHLKAAPLDAELLRTFLLGLVPLAIAEQQGASDGDIEAIRSRCLELIASHGDALQFGGRHRAESRTALAEAMALLARQPGGVTRFGIHACTHEHEYCPGYK